MPAYSFFFIFFLLLYQSIEYTYKYHVADHQLKNIFYSRNEFNETRISLKKRSWYIFSLTKASDCLNTELLLNKLDLYRVKDNVLKQSGAMGSVNIKFFNSKILIKKMEEPKVVYWDHCYFLFLLMTCILRPINR